MIIVNQTRTSAVNVDQISVIKVDKTKVLACQNDTVVLLGAYASELKAEQAFRSILESLRKDIIVFEMPKSFN